MSTPQDPFSPPPASAGPREGGQPATAPTPAAPDYRAPAGYGGAGTGAPPAPRNGLGTAALILGILAVLGTITVFLGILVGLVALILGMVARGRVKRGEATNGGQALAGAILGAVALVASVLFIVVGVSIFAKSGGGTLVDCLSKAGNDQAAVQKCQQDFQSRVNGGG